MEALVLTDLGVFSRMVTLAAVGTEPLVDESVADGGAFSPSAESSNDRL